MGIQAVFFDLDETLLDDDAAMRGAASLTCHALARKYPWLDIENLADTYTRLSNEAWTSYGSVPKATGSVVSSGREIRQQVWGRALSLYGISHRDAAELAATVYQQERRRTYRLFPDAVELLTAILGRFKTGIITNGAGDVQREKILVTGIGAFIDELFISGELGVGKPDPEIFRIGLQTLGVSSDEALHIGDSLSSDIAGAKSAGMQTVWVNRKNMPRDPQLPTPDIEIPSLTNLMPILLGR